MGEDRLFSPEELQALGQRTLDLLLESLDAGDVEKGKKLGQRMYNEFSAMHDLYRDWVTDLLTFIGRRYGDKDLAEALNQSVGTFISALGQAYAGKNLRRQVEMLAAGLRGHLQPLTIEEDDEKFTFSMHPCGSGGRLALGGAYGPPRNFLKIKDPQPMTFGRSDFPVYCAHCYFQNIIPMQPDNKPMVITEPAAKLGEEPCRGYLYKDKK